MSIKACILRSLFWINDFFHGSPVRSEYRRIRAVQQYGKSVDSELAALLEYACDHSPFYRACKGMPLDSFPVVDKNIIRTRMPDIMVAEHLNPYQKKGCRYHIQKTSGSTGTPFAVPQDTRKRNRRLAELKYFGEEVGFNSHDELLQLRIWTKWQSKGGWQAFRENITPFDCSTLDDARLDELCRIVQEKSIRCIRGYANSYDFIARYVTNHAVKLPSLRVLIAGSEALLDATRLAVHEALPHAAIISQYANEECGILAQEHPGEPNVFHLNRAGYIVEVLQMESDQSAGEGELGRIVLTDLTNYALPLIRYDTGDTGVLKHDSHGVPYLDKLYGRKLDIIYNVQGEPVYPMFFARVLKNYPQIMQWQFIQRGRVTYTLRLSLAGETAFSDGEDVLQALQELLGNSADITMEYVDEIPVLGSGKRKCVLNEWTQKH